MSDYTSITQYLTPEDVGHEPTDDLEAFCDRATDWLTDHEPDHWALEVTPASPGETGRTVLDASGTSIKYALEEDERDEVEHLFEQAWMHACSTEPPERAPTAETTTPVPGAITADTTRTQLTDHLDALGVEYTLDPTHTGQGPRYFGDDMDRGGFRVPAADLLVYWDDQDPTCQGWAYNVPGPDGHSGPLDTFDELTGLAGA